MTYDSFHNDTYDAEGNALNVDSGATAKYVYDPLNRRVRVDNAGGSFEFLFDYGGRRVSTWQGPNNNGNEGRARQV